MNKKAKPTDNNQISISSYNDAMKVCINLQECIRHKTYNDKFILNLSSVLDIDPSCILSINHSTIQAFITYLDSVNNGINFLKDKLNTIGFVNACRLLDKPGNGELNKSKKKQFKRRLNMIFRLYENYVSDLFILFRKTYDTESDLNIKMVLYKHFDKLRLRYPCAFLEMSEEFRSWVMEIDKQMLTKEKDKYKCVVGFCDEENRPYFDSSSGVDKLFWKSIYQNNYNELFSPNDNLITPLVINNSQLSVYDVLKKFDAELYDGSFQKCYNNLCCIDYNNMLNMESFDENRHGSVKEGVASFDEVDDFSSFGNDAQNTNDDLKKSGMAVEVHFVSSHRTKEHIIKFIDLFLNSLTAVPSKSTYRELPILHKLKLAMNYGSNVSKYIFFLSKSATKQELEKYVFALKNIELYSVELKDFIDSIDSASTLPSSKSQLLNELSQYPQAIRNLMAKMDIGAVSKKLDRLVKTDYFRMMIASGLYGELSTTLSLEAATAWIINNDASSDWHLRNFLRCTMLG